MKKRLLLAFSSALVTLVLILVGGIANASPLTFYFTFDGASYNNTAIATGQITFEDALLSNTVGFNQYDIVGPEIISLTVTITGASSGNGTFTDADFLSVIWDTNGTLDFTTQLIGQPTVGLLWGTPDGGGDFNIFTHNDSIHPPCGNNYFTLTTSNATGDSMYLTSMTTVPIPSTIILLTTGLAGLLGSKIRKIKR